MEMYPDYRPRPVHQMNGLNSLISLWQAMTSNYDHVTDNSTTVCKSVASNITITKKDRVFLT